MESFEENTTLVGVTELRSRMKAVQKAMKTSRVVLGRRNKPLAVLVPLDRYQKMEEMFEILEDRALGYLAKERDRSTKTSDYLDLDTVEKRLKLK